MSLGNEIIIGILVIILAPLLGGLIAGIDRKITARFQSRRGPTVFQPYWDVIKLLGKERFVVNSLQNIYVLASLAFAVAALLMLVFKQDLLMLVFVLAFSTVSLIVGAMCVRSPYSKIGAQREIIQILAYEPVIILMAIGMYLISDSFCISEILDYQQNFETSMFFHLPLLFISFIFILTIKLRKSPFDFSMSHHGHQELIKGLTTEFSGIQLALIEITHWIETVLYLGLIMLFFGNSWFLGLIIAVVCYFIEIVIDNVSARTTWPWMLKVSYSIGFGLAITNIIWIYLRGGIM
ncbi:MAG: NADH-quinone oxidoreductase subunit H [Armatimonadetes bacterium]|nr:NADH-quinone oxidoreductase subunit H [Candidatus Hippobium faecium]